jgi:Carbohydrate binding module (family 6)
MSVSRRTFIASAAGVIVGATAVGTVASGLASASAVKPAASGPGDVVGKITVGYQGWFACIGDNAPIDAWWHWSNNESQAPSPSNNNIKAWPDMTVYDAVYETAYANLGDGAPATLFSSYDQSTVNVHFQLMQQNGCDTAALQRFDPNGSEGPTRNAVTAKVNTAAQAYDRKFYVMYDASGWTNMQTEMPADWTANMAQYTSSSAYAHQNGKPVVGIWGFGFDDTNHPWSAAACLEVVQWFQSQGCYVMGGVPTYWRTGVSDSRSGYSAVYDAFNMLSPWMVGRIGSAADSDSFYTNVNVGDQAYCNANGIDYQPCVLPGDVSASQRAHGDFMWEQFYNMVRVGAQGLYISMFDEYGEGNQILNTAATQQQVPTGSGLLALDEDGTACSSDYYLRLTNDGGRMLKGQIALTNVRPTPPEPTASGLTVTASAFAASNSVGTEATADTGGGDDVGWITSASWLQYDDVDFGSGYGTVAARFASAQSGSGIGTIQFRLDSLTAAPFATVTVNGTGGWQDWATSAPVPATSTPTGTHTLYVTFTTTTGGEFVNVNWFEFTGGTNGSVTPSPQALTASAFTASNSVETEATSDTGGGDDVGWINSASWLEYSGVDFGSALTGHLQVRLASALSGSGIGTVQFRLDSLTATPIATVTVNGTGGWQSWQTSGAVTTSPVPSGIHTLYVTFTTSTGGNFVNLNWFDFS